MNGDGTFTNAPSVDGAVTNASNLAVADFNQHGEADLVLMNSLEASILSGNGDGTFNSAGFTANDTVPSSSVVADWNGDEIPDLAATDDLLGLDSTIVVETSVLAQTAAVTVDGVALAGHGQHAVSASYPGDASYQESVSVPTTLIAGLIPNVSLSFASSSITTEQLLTVLVYVTGPAGDPVPTGSIVLTSGNYVSGPTILSSGAATLTLPAGSLSTENDSLSVAYVPDTTGSATYTNASGSSVVAVSKTTPTTSVTLSTPSITTVRSVTVLVSVGSGIGNPVPTGSITVSGGKLRLGCVSP